MGAKKKIFISYSRADLEYVVTLVDALRKKGADVWFDKNIRTGEQWDNILENQIKAADVFLIVMSKTSVDSDNVKDEMSYAKNLGKIISPILIESCDVPMRLARHQYIDFTQDFGWAVNRLIEDLDAAEISALGASSVNSGKHFQSSSPVSPAFVKKPKMYLYVLGGAVGIILLIFLLGSLIGDDSDIDENEFVTEQTEYTDWDRAVDANSIDSYLNYIYKYGDEDAYYKDAQQAIDYLMPNIGVVLYEDTSGYTFLVKNLYTALDGTLQYGQSDGEYPEEGDILTAIEATQVFDENNGQAIDGEFIVTGQKVRVLNVEYREDDNVFITISYPDTF